MLNILVVEDEFIIAEHISKTLEELGYSKPRVAMDYDEAIREMEEQKPDLAILDITLKGSKNGLEIGKWIRENLKIPFLFLTSHSDPSTLANSKILQPSAFLVKPFKKPDLFAAIEIAIANSAKEEINELMGEQDSIFPVEEGVLIKNAIFIKRKTAFEKIAFERIAFVKSDRVYLEIFLENGEKILVRDSLTRYQEKLGSGFFRMGRSFIVNLGLIDSIGEEVVTISGQEVLVGKTARDTLMRRVMT